LAKCTGWEQSRSRMAKHTWVNGRRGNGLGNSSSLTL
jgi:hypothetical protein